MSEPVSIGWAIFLSPSVPALALALAAVGDAGFRLGGLAPSLRDRVLATAVWTSALVVAYSQALSLAGQLHWPGALVVSVAGALAVRALVPSPSARLFGQLQSARREIPAHEAVWLLAFALPALGYAAFAAWLAVASAEPLSDAVTYHLPRLAYWIQHQSLAPFPSNDPRISTFPLNGNVLQLWPALFLKRERLSDLVQVASHFGAAFAAYACARDLRAPRPAAAAAAFCWLAIPVALAQAATANVDLVAAFFAGASSALAVACLRRGEPANGWAAFACAALTVGTKPQAALVALVACACASHLFWRRDGARALRRAPAVAALFLVLGGLGPLANARTYGSPAGLTSVEWVVLSPGAATLAKNAQLVALPFTAEHGLGVPLPGWPANTAPVSRGLGVLWLGALAIAVPLAGWRLARERALFAPAAVYLALGLVFFVFVAAVMRHQPSVDRFLLPAAAVLTPALGAAFSGRRLRRVTVPLAVLLGTFILLHWASIERARRRGPHRRFWTAGDLVGPQLGSLLQAAQDLTRGGPGSRIGLVSAQTSIQRLLLGRRFQNVLVPLSVDPPVDRAALDRLQLDAVVVEIGSGFQLELFREAFRAPPRAPESWKMTAVDAFDEDFLRAYRAAVHYPDFGRTALLLGARGSGWRLKKEVRANGLFFVRGVDPMPALGIVHAENPNGVDLHAGGPFYWMGTETLTLRVFAGEAGRAELRGTLLTGPHLPRDFAPLDVVPDGQPPIRFATTGGRLVVPLTVPQGLSHVHLAVRDVPVRVPPGERTRMLGLQDADLVWAP